MEARAANGEASEMRKSCDYCVIRKRKCDGKGVLTCRLVKAGATQQEIFLFFIYRRVNLAIHYSTTRWANEELDNF